MMQSSYLHNNEALAAVSIGHFLSLQRQIEFSKLLFILPFVLHEPSVKRLRSSSYKRSLEEFIIKNIDCVINFNSRFEDYLPVTVNSVTILREIGVISVDGTLIRFNPDFEELFLPEENDSVGDRASDIFKANKSLHKLMQIETTESFYLKLRILL